MIKPFHTMTKSFIPPKFSQRFGQMETTSYLTVYCSLLGKHNIRENMEAIVYICLEFRTLLIAHCDEQEPRGLPLRQELRLGSLHRATAQKWIENIQKYKAHKKEHRLIFSLDTAVYRKAVLQGRKSVHDNTERNCGQSYLALV